MRRIERNKHRAPAGVRCRVAIDQFIRVKALAHVFAAGDVASARLDGAHATVMSCQFARPMGRYAGHNVVAALFGQPMIALDTKQTINRERIYPPRTGSRADLFAAAAPSVQAPPKRRS